MNRISRVLGISLANSQQCTKKLEEKFVHVVLDYEVEKTVKCGSNILSLLQNWLREKITLTAMDRF